MRVRRNTCTSFINDKNVLKNLIFKTRPLAKRDKASRYVPDLHTERNNNNLSAKLRFFPPISTIFRPRKHFLDKTAIILAVSNEWFPSLFRRRAPSSDVETLTSLKGLNKKCKFNRANDRSSRQVYDSKCGEIINWLRFGDGGWKESITSNPTDWCI